jgi:hypothetical protein
MEPCRAPGRGRGRLPGRAASSCGRGRRGRSSNCSRGRGRGRDAVVKDGCIGTAGTGPKTIDNDGSHGEAAVLCGQGHGHPTGRFCRSLPPYKPAALQVQVDWEMKSLGGDMFYCTVWQSARGD